MTVSWTVKNQGTGTAFGTWYDQVFLSTDQSISANDVSLSNPSKAGPVAANASYSMNGQLITIPSNQPAGSYYLLFRTDVYSSLFEDGQEANNTWGTPIALTVQVPDLVPTAFTASTTTIVKGLQMTVSWTVKNQGTGTAFGTWYDQVFLSTDQFISANDVSLSNPSHAGPLAVNGTYDTNGQSITIPANTTPGAYYLLFRTDVYGSLFEDGQESNNEWGAPRALTVN
jgi:CARDB protein